MEQTPWLTWNPKKAAKLWKPVGLSIANSNQNLTVKQNWRCFCTTTNITVYKNKIQIYGIMFFPTNVDGESDFKYWHEGEKYIYVSLKLVILWPNGHHVSDASLYQLLTAYDEQWSPLVYAVCRPPPWQQNPANRWVTGPQWASAPSLFEACPFHTYTLYCSLN